MSFRNSPLKASGRHFGPWGPSGEEPLRTVQVEPERPPEVDMREVRRSNPPTPINLNSDTVAVGPRHDAVHAICDPDEHDLGQRCERTRGRHLLPPAATLWVYWAAMDHLRG